MTTTPRTAPILRRGRLIVGLGLLLAGCAGADVEVPGPHYDTKAERDRIKYGSALGDNYDSGIVLFSNRDHSRPDGDGGGAAGIGVNGYLWRASLETLDFLPLASADPFGGTIITEWYAPPETPDERFKMNVYILGRELRADGVKVSVFRQVRENGVWVDAPVAQDTATAIEDRILTRARELRIAGLGSN